MIHTRGPFGDYELEEEATTISIKTLEGIRANHQCAWVIWKNDQDGDEEPMLIDTTTANAVLTVFEAMSEKNQELAQDLMAKSAAHFTKLVRFVWICLK